MSAKMMEQVTISPKFQVVIPKKIREKLGLKAGQKIEAIEYNGIIQLVPVKTADELKGLLGDVEIEIDRETDRY